MTSSWHLTVGYQKFAGTQSSTEWQWLDKNNIALVTVLSTRSQLMKECIIYNTLNLKIPSDNLYDTTKIFDYPWNHWYQTSMPQHFSSASYILPIDIQYSLLYIYNQIGFIPLFFISMWFYVYVYIYISWTMVTFSACDYVLQCISLTHWVRINIDVILQTTVSTACSWIKPYEFRLRFHWSLFLMIQSTIFQHWFK